MRRYETIVLIDPDIPEEQREPIFDRVREIIPTDGGFLIQFDDWGVQKMAYEIQNKPRAYYVRLEYCGVGAAVDEIERGFRIDDRVMRYLTVMQDDNPDVEAIQQMMSETEAAAAEQAASEEVTGEEAAGEEETQAETAETSPGTEETTEAAEEE